MDTHYTILKYPDPFTLSRELSQRYRGKNYISRVPFLMNETVDTSKVMLRLQHAAVEDDRVFMGVSGLRALDLIASIGEAKGKTYQHAVLFDVNEAQVKAMNGVLHLIAQCETPEQFEQEFIKMHTRITDHVPVRDYTEKTSARMKDNPSHQAFDQLREDKNYFGVVGAGLINSDPEKAQGFFERTRNSKESFLRPQHYKRIRELVMRGRIKNITLDFTDEKRFAILKKDFDRQELKLGHAYLSSVLGIMAEYKSNDYHSGDNGPLQRYEQSDYGRSVSNFASLGDTQLPNDPQVHFICAGNIPYETKFVLQLMDVENAHSGGRLDNDFWHESSEFRNHILSHAKYIGVGRRTISVHCANFGSVKSFMRESHHAYKDASNEDMMITICKERNQPFTASEVEAYRALARDPLFTENSVTLDPFPKEGAAPRILNMHIPFDLSVDKPELAKALFDKAVTCTESLRPVLLRSAHHDGDAPRR